MTEGIVRIYLSYKEPEDKNLFWLRPYLDREGYELLFFGAKGWTTWHCCKDDCVKYPEEYTPSEKPDDSKDEEDEDLELCEDEEKDPCGCK